MDLFGHDSPPLRHPATPFDAEAAKRLRAIVNTAEGRSPRAHRSSSWANELRLLREELADGEARITAVLDWYGTAVGRPYVPDVRCAASFRAKFGKLEAAMGRGAPAPKKRKPTAEALLIVDHCTNQPWPAGAEEGLPDAVQSSLDALSEFLDKVFRLRKRLEAADGLSSADRAMLRLAREVAAEVDPREHLQQWWGRVRRSVANWDEWSGKLEPFVWSPQHRWAQAAGRGWADGDADLWTAFLKKLG